MMKGFTLVELVIVIVIVAILSIVGVMEYQFQVEKAIATEAIANLRAIANAQQLYYLEHKKYFRGNINNFDITIWGKKGVSSESRNATKYWEYGINKSGNTLAIAQRKPISQYFIYIAVDDTNSTRLKAGYTGNASYNPTSIQKTIVAKINKKGKL